MSSEIKDIFSIRNICFVNELVPGSSSRDLEPDFEIQRKEFLVMTNKAFQLHRGPLFCMFINRVLFIYSSNSNTNGNTAISVYSFIRLFGPYLQTDTRHYK